jgi:metal-responsive CopG/Arc/MetJ family transcriptional regulator
VSEEGGSFAFGQGRWSGGDGNCDTARTWSFSLITVQMTLDEDLVQTVDRFAKNLHTTRSAFAREALQRAVARVTTQRLEEQHRRGYLRKPAGPAEFGAWEKEQKWGDRIHHHIAFSGSHARNSGRDCLCHRPQ